MTAGETVRSAPGTAREVTGSKPYRWLVRGGIVAYGVVHLLVAWIAAQLVVGGDSKEASQTGALQELADKPFGQTLLWGVAVGLFALALWQVSMLLAGGDWKDKLSPAGRTVVYLGLGVLAARTATGSGGGGAEQQQTFSARLMENTAGRVLVVLIGAAVIAVGVRHAYKAVTKRFTDDLAGGVSRGTVLLGRIGYAAKAVALGIAGALFAWAAIDYDPAKAGGLDTALRTLRDQPFGSVLLGLVAAGIACFGVYCFAWARHART